MWSNILRCKAYFLVCCNLLLWKAYGSLINRVDSPKMPLKAEEVEMIIKVINADLNYKHLQNVISALEIKLGFLPLDLDADLTCLLKEKKKKKWARSRSSSADDRNQQIISNNVVRMTKSEELKDGLINRKPDEFVKITGSGKSIVMKTVTVTQPSDQAGSPKSSPRTKSSPKSISPGRASQLKSSPRKLSPRIKAASSSDPVDSVSKLRRSSKEEGEDTICSSTRISRQRNRGVSPSCLDLTWKIDEIKEYFEECRNNDAFSEGCRESTSDSASISGFGKTNIDWNGNKDLPCSKADSPKKADSKFVEGRTHGEAFESPKKGSPRTKIEEKKDKDRIDSSGDELGKKKLKDKLLKFTSSSEKKQAPITMEEEFKRMVEFQVDAQEEAEPPQKVSRHLFTKSDESSDLTRPMSALERAVRATFKDEIETELSPKEESNKGILPWGYISHTFQASAQSFDSDCSDNSDDEEPRDTLCIRALLYGRVNHLVVLILNGASLHPYSCHQICSLKVVDAVDKMKVLMGNGGVGYVNVLDHFGFTPLHYLIMNLNSDALYALPLIRILIDYGADADTLDRYGQSALFVFLDRIYHTSPVANEVLHLLLMTADVRKLLTNGKTIIDMVRTETDSIEDRSRLQEARGIVEDVLSKSRRPRMRIPPYPDYGTTLI